MRVVVIEDALADVWWLEMQIAVNRRKIEAELRKRPGLRKLVEIALNG